MLRRIISLVLSFGLLFQQISFAQVAAELNIANYLSRIGSNIVQDKFRPLHLRYFSYDNLNDNFKVLLDKGDLKNLKTPELESSTKTLLSYFLVGVTLPDSMFWVNLRPDSEDQIIDGYLEKTDVGKIMLEADLQLKKDTASFTSPQTSEGREYWDKLYKKAAELYGYDNVTIPTLTRPWIVPGEIIIRESKDSAYVYKATLKVMLEQDYLKDSTTYNFKDERSKTLNEYSSQLIRELIIPKLTKEVNSSKRYAALRQVYYSLILSRWFKLRFTGKTGTYASLINTRNLTNLISQESWSKTEYFKQYQKSFAKGEYNIKEPVYTPTGQVIRSYFSGGINVASSAINTQNGIILSNDNVNKLGDVIGGKAVVDPQSISLKPAVVSSPVKNSDEKLSSSAVVKTTHDVRSAVIEKLKEKLGSDRYEYYPGGFASIDLTPKGIDKATALYHLYEEDSLQYGIYFGNEYFKNEKKTGNDLSTIVAKKNLEKKGKELFLISVDKDPNERSEEAGENTVWIGNGPLATKKVLRAIVEGLRNNLKEIKISGDGLDSSRVITVNLEKLRTNGVLAFDVDETILERRGDSFITDTVIADLFRTLLAGGIRLSIVSGNSSAEQRKRISDALSGTVGLEHFIMYVNGGATRVEFTSDGTHRQYNIAGKFPPEDIARIQSVLAEMARNNFGLNTKELNAWQTFFTDGEKRWVRPDFPGVQFKPWWDSQEFLATIVKAEDIGGSAKEITEPWIENRDSAQISIKLLPKALDMPMVSKGAALLVSDKSSEKEFSLGGESFETMVNPLIAPHLTSQAEYFLVGYYVGRGNVDYYKYIFLPKDSLLEGIKSEIQDASRIGLYFKLEFIEPRPELTSEKIAEMTWVQLQNQLFANDPDREAIIHGSIKLKDWNVSSSPMAQKDKNGVGGIDFRVLPMTIQPMGSFSGLNFKLPQLSQTELRQINVDSEMQQIKNMVQSEIVPSGQRIKELIAACVQKKEMNSQIDNLLLCLADIFKLEEDNASESSSELKEALVIVDSQS